MICVPNTPCKVFNVQISISRIQSDYRLNIQTSKYIQILKIRLDVPSFVGELTKRFSWNLVLLLVEGYHMQ